MAGSPLPTCPSQCQSPILTTEPGLSRFHAASGTAPVAHSGPRTIDTARTIGSIDKLCLFGSRNTGIWQFRQFAATLRKEFAFTDSWPTVTGFPFDIAMSPSTSERTMQAHANRVIRTLEGVHCAILGLSTFLAGLYFGRAIPAGIDLLVLQVALIGLVGFLGLANLSAIRHLRRMENTEAGQVEQRLDRHTSKHWFYGDKVASPACHIPATVAGSTVYSAQVNPA